MAGVLVAMALTPGLAKEFVASLVTVAIVGAAFLIFRKGKAAD
jgi:hypothetical protein